MSYQFYKVLHVSSIMLFFVLYMSACFKDKSNMKKEVIFTGVALVLMLVSGMGLIARLGFPHGEAWPLWVNIKLGVWFIIGISGHMVLKRFPDFRIRYFWVAFGLFVLNAVMAIYKVS